MQFFNWLGPLATALGILFLNLMYLEGRSYKFWLVLVTVGNYLTILVQIVSACILGNAIWKIQTLIKECGNSSDSINIGLLIQHFLAFALYLLS